MGFTIATPVASRAVRSYRTFSPLPSQKLGGFLSAALSVGSRPPGVTWHPDLRSPDFPPPPEGQQRSSDQLCRQCKALDRRSQVPNLILFPGQPEDCRGRGNADP